MNAPHPLSQLTRVVAETYDRRRFLGGADAAAIIGVSPWMTPLDLFHKKTSDGPESIDEKRAKFFRNRNPVIKGPWSDHFEEMGRKTAIRRLSKFLPLSVELATAVSMADTAERGEAQNLETVLDGEYTVAPDLDVDDELAGAGSADAKGNAAAGTTGGEQTTGAAKGKEAATSKRKSEAPAGPTVAEISESINKAKTMDELNVARDLIRYAPNEFQAELEKDAAAKAEQLAPKE